MPNSAPQATITLLESQRHRLDNERAAAVPRCLHAIGALPAASMDPGTVDRTETALVSPTHVTPSLDILSVGQMHALIIALDKLQDEIVRATAKHPGSAMMVEALAEEFGELCSCPVTQIDAPGNQEALHIACVALRIYIHGAPDTTVRLANADAHLHSLMGSLRAIGYLATQRLRD